MSTRLQSAVKYIVSSPLFAQHFLSELGMFVRFEGVCMVASSLTSVIYNIKMVTLIVILVRIIVGLSATFLLLLIFPIELILFTAWVILLVLSGKTISETRDSISMSGWEFPSTLRTIPDVWSWVLEV